MSRIRSKHNNLLNYFLYNNQDLSPGYVRSCEKFFKSFKLQAASGPAISDNMTRQAASSKPQAPSALKKTQ